MREAWIEALRSFLDKHMGAVPENTPERHNTEHPETK